MLKKTITYTDYNGVERTEDFFFNLSKSEVIEMQMSVTGTLSEKIEKIIKSPDVPTIISVFKELILRSYGEKSADGKRFIKSPELSEAFSQTEAYDKLFVEFADSPETAAAFCTGILPEELRPSDEELKKAALSVSGSEA